MPTLAAPHREADLAFLSLTRRLVRAARQGMQADLPPRQRASGNVSAGRLFGVEGGVKR